MKSNFQPSGVDQKAAERLADVLQKRLIGLIDLSLVLKHAHWNVVGPGFMAVHELLDDQVEKVRAMADEVAERIATLGGIPNGLAGFLTENRDWEDYPIGKAVVEAHLGALDKAYDGVIGDHRDAIEACEKDDVVTADLLTAQTGSLELLHWFVRGHIETTSGTLPTTDEESRLGAAAAAATSNPLN